MPVCPAVKANGEPCTRNGAGFEGHCGTHQNAKIRTDPEYKRRYDAYMARIHLAAAARAGRAAAEAQAARQQAVEQQAARAARAAQQQVERAAAAVERAEKRTREVLKSAEYSVSKSIVAVRILAEMWRDYNIAGDDCVTAYTVLRYMSMRHAGFTALMRAVVSFIYMRDGHYPNVERYVEIPVAEREAALEAIRAALVAYGPVSYATIVPRSDNLIWPEVRRRAEEARREELREALRRRNEEQAAAQEQHRRQFEADLRERPVVFQRDPEGGINLAAFATDNQNIHRSSVQSATHKMVLAIMKRPKTDEDVALVEICEDFRTPQIVHWNNDHTRDRTIQEFERDYNELEAFSVKYAIVIDHVWAFIRPHEHRKELTIRLAQEMWEGRGMCSNGKMARLMNVIQGFDDTLEMEAPRELFHDKFAKLTAIPHAERAAAAAAIFDEFNIPEVERNDWLEPLMEHDDANVGGGAGGI